MATSLKTPITLIYTIGIALLLTTANARSSSPSKKTSFSYNFYYIKSTDLTYQGDAFFPSEIPYLRLTKTDFNSDPVQYSTGRVLHTKPVLFSNKKKQASFETTVKFIIRNQYGDDNPADGLIFFIAPVGSTPEDGGANYGVFDSLGNNPSVFAVEFDIYINDDDPSYRHVGIDIGTKISKNLTEVDDAIVGKEVTACIAYSAATKMIRVNGSSVAGSFEVSYVYDLGNILPPKVQVGLSATTGMSVAVHDVLSWSFRSELVHVKA